MKMVELFGAQLEREAAITRRSLERVPEGRADWKPHEKSMPLGYLSTLVASMPSWIEMAIRMDELDLATGEKPPAWTKNSELVEVHEKSIARGREALRATTDEHLRTPWRLKVAGQTVMEAPRHVVIEDTFTHLAHHRGQLSVYLRLNGAAVPSIYGPTADEQAFR